MGEWRLFEEGTVPEWTTAAWYVGRENAPHLEQVHHRDRLLTSARLVAQASMTRGRPTLVDLGAGDGGLLSLVRTAVKGWGYDLAPAAVEAAKDRHADVRYADVLTDPIEWGQIAVATEMLEHLIDPHGFVGTIAAHSDTLICSSPWNERPGSAYEFHTWAWDRDGYADMIEAAGFVVRQHKTVGPFQVILAVKP